MPQPEALEYVLPLRWESDEGLDELTAYLRRLSEWVDVTVVDGSPNPRFEAHRRAWPFVRHLAPAVSGANGTARGAMTGIGLSRHDGIVIADDDVRYERAELLRLGGGVRYRDSRISRAATPLRRLKRAAAASASRTPQNCAELAAIPRNPANSAQSCEVRDDDSDEGADP